MHKDNNMPITRRQVLTNPRLAGQLKRYHTWPTLQQQTVADHSFNCMLIWYRIWGPLPLEVSTFFIWHDLGEIAVGDPPYPAKANNVVFKQSHDALEALAVLEMGGPMLKLHPDDVCRAKACDLLEMYEFGLMEKVLGNKFAAPIIDDISESFHKLLLSNKDKERVIAYGLKVLDGLDLKEV